MGMLLIILALLVAIMIPILWIIFIAKGKSILHGRIMGPLGPRHREGALTYNEYRGVRTNIEVEDPRGPQNQRYQRRHSSRSRKQTKPWMK